MRRTGIICVAAWLWAWGSGFAQEASSLDQARDLWKVGRYEESLEAYDAVAKGLPAGDEAAAMKLAIGRAEAFLSTGKVDEAIALLKARAGLEKPEAEVLARLAMVEFDRGQWEEAAEHAKQALEIDADHLLGRFVAARLREARGQDEAADWRWFIDQFNLKRGELAGDSQAMVLTGQAAERYYRKEARGEDLAQGLNDVINDLYEGAIQVDPKCWQGAWLQGKLFLSGYRERDARKELNRALLINPSAVEVLVTLGQADLQGYQLAEGRRKAEAATEINPAYGPAYVLLADLNISDERFRDALEASKKGVAQNPRDEQALGRLAASHRLLVDPVGAAAAEAAAHRANEKPADFYAAIGERLADRRKYQSAERAFLQAIEADPDRADTRLGLGMLYMQVGRETEARELFGAAFAGDPFNVRADNMMRVLEQLATYEAVESEHYRVVVLPEQDELLGKYMSKFLEEAHEGLVERFGYEPPGKTTIEIMKDHQWFSGRTTGLPFIPTVGACTGKVVALASPRATRKPFNWSRVMVHEVAHVITLQQTDFNIPHWFTEALAVESEETPRPQPWNTMLLERVPERKRLLNLDTINLGFIRPEQAEDRQMAYCQAQLYAQYMVEKYGEDALPKMLRAYRQGLTTDRAIKASFGVEKEEFEQGYLEFLDKVVKTLKGRVENEVPVPFSKLQQQLAEKPEDAELNARMAYEHFARREYREARPYADKALELSEHHPLASYVKGRLYQSIGDESAALAVLRPALDEDEPNERVVDLLAELEMKAGRLDEAARLYELARQEDPYQSKWIAGLARVHLRQGDREKLLGSLGLLAANDSDDLEVRRTLAAEYLARKDYEEAAKWANECLHIEVYDPAHHVMLGDALAGLKRGAAAIEEYQVALELKPKKPGEIQLKLAEAQVQEGLMKEARETIETVLKADPGNPEAKSLLEKVGAGE